MATTYVNDSVTVGSSTTVVSSAKEERQYVVLCNDSNETMYLAINASAVLNKGIRLDPGEKFIIEKVAIDTKANCNEVINAICTSGSKVLTICERYLTAL